MKKRLASYHALLIRLSTTWILLTLLNCCQLGITCYELVIGGEPELNNASIYLNGNLIKTSASGTIFLNVPYGKQEIKIVQKDFKPFITILDAKRGERGEQRLWVEFEPLDSMPSTPSSQADTGKSVK